METELKRKRDEYAAGLISVVYVVAESAERIMLSSQKSPVVETESA
jgi:hypothetical protein